MPELQDVCKRQGNYQWDTRGIFRSSDYAYARMRARSSKQLEHHPERGYDFALKRIAARRRDQGQLSLQRIFREHADRWRNETGHFSSIQKITSHPSYLRIIGFGQDALPLILKELKERPDHWLVALNAITGEDPAPEGATFREAIAAWIKWGEGRGFR